MRTPLPDCVKVLERKAQRIYGRVTTRAGRILAMLFHELTQRQRLTLGSTVVQTRNVGRRWRWGRPQQVLQQPLAAQNNRGAVGIRIDSQETALAEKSTPYIKVRSERHAPKITAVHVGNSVMTRQTLVQKRIVHVQQSQNTLILAERAFKK